MAEHKRTEFEIERDREEIARLYLRGQTQQEISNYLNEKYYQANPLSRVMISYDIRILIDRWNKSAVNHIEQKKAIELAKVNEVETAAWDGWERSCKDAVTHIEGDTARGHQDYFKTEGQSGNPAFLEIVLKCVDKRCQILGINAPTKIAPTDPTGEKEYTGLGDTERAERILALLDQAKKRQDEQSRIG